MTRASRATWAFLLFGVAMAACGQSSDPAQGGEGLAGASAVPWCRVEKVLKAKCFSCHTAPQSPAQPQFASYAEVVVHAEQVQENVQNGAMPPPGQASLTTEERALIVNWAKQPQKDLGGTRCAGDP